MRGKVHEIQRTQFEREKNLTVHDGSLGKKENEFFEMVTVEFQFENNNKLCNGYMEILILLCALLQTERKVLVCCCHDETEEKKRMEHGTLGRVVVSVGH